LKWGKWSISIDGKAIDSLAKVAEIAERLPTLARVVVIPYLADEPAIGTVRNGVLVGEFIASAEARDIEFAQLPFDHALYIMYSSGTTRVPKCIVHSAGGTLLQHLKGHQLHSTSGRATGCSTSPPAAG